MKSFAVVKTFGKSTLEGSYGHDNNPYFVSFFDKPCDAQEHAYQMAQLEPEPIEESMISDSSFRGYGWRIIVINKQHFYSKLNHTWDKEHSKYDGAYIDKNSKIL